MNKKIVSAVLALIMCLVLTLSLCACEKGDVNPTQAPEVTATADEVTEAVDPVWKNATYTEDATVGEGKTSVDIKVTAGDKSVVITLKTDEKYLEDALLKENLIAGDESEYGLYIKTVNGIIADYDTDKTYWAIYKDSEYMMEGAGVTEVKSGKEYEFVRTK